MAETQRLGATKNIMYRKFYFFIILVFVACCLNDFSFNIPCLSFTLALQRSNESYKLIMYPTKRTRFFSVENAQFTRLFVYSVSYSTISLWLLCILLRSGDIQPNPGPASETSSLNSSLSSIDSIQDLSNHLSIMHLNIQSIQPKLDLVKCESHAYDVLIYSESWLKPEIKDNDILIENFLPPYRTDRVDRPGGGL